jgi:hypothetical protein
MLASPAPVCMCIVRSGVYAGGGGRRWACGGAAGVEGLGSVVSTRWSTRRRAGRPATIPHRSTDACASPRQHRRRLLRTCKGLHSSTYRLLLAFGCPPVRLGRRGPSGLALRGAFHFVGNAIARVGLAQTALGESERWVVAAAVGCERISSLHAVSASALANL